MATKKTSTKSSKKSIAKSGAAKKAAAPGGKKRVAASKTSKRTLIEPHKGDRRYVRRNKEGEFKSMVDVGRSLAADRRSISKTKVAKGQGDRGDASGSGIIATVKKALKM